MLLIRAGLLPVPLVGMLYPVEGNRRARVILRGLINEVC